MNNKHLRSLSWGRMQWGKRKNRRKEQELHGK